MNLKELVWQCCESPGEPSNTHQFQCDGGMRTIISKYMNVQKAYNKYVRSLCIKYGLSTEI